MEKGAFHRYLGIKSDKPIPLNRAMAALASPDSHVKKMAQFAVNMKKAARKRKP